MLSMEPDTALDPTEKESEKQRLFDIVQRSLLITQLEIERSKMSSLIIKEQIIRNQINAAKVEQDNIGILLQDKNVEDQDISTFLEKTIVNEHREREIKETQLNAISLALTIQYDLELFQLETRRKELEKSFKDVKSFLSHKPDYEAEIVSLQWQLHDCCEKQAMDMSNLRNKLDEAMRLRKQNTEERISNSRSKISEALSNQLDEITTDLIQYNWRHADEFRFQCIEVDKISTLYKNLVNENFSALIFIHKAGQDELKLVQFASSLHCKLKEMQEKASYMSKKSTAVTQIMPSQFISLNNSDPFNSDHGIFTAVKMSKIVSNKPIPAKCSTFQKGDDESIADLHNLLHKEYIAVVKEHRLVMQLHGHMYSTMNRIIQKGKMCRLILHLVEQWSSTFSTRRSYKKLQPFKCSLTSSFKMDGNDKKYLLRTLSLLFKNNGSSNIQKRSLIEKSNEFPVICIREAKKGNLTYPDILHGGNITAAYEHHGKLFAGDLQHKELQINALFCKIDNDPYFNDDKQNLKYCSSVPLYST